MSYDNDGNVRSALGTFHSSTGGGLSWANSHDQFMAGVNSLDTEFSAQSKLHAYRMKNMGYVPGTSSGGNSWFGRLFALAFVGAILLFLHDSIDKHLYKMPRNVGMFTHVTPEIGKPTATDVARLQAETKLAIQTQYEEMFRQPLNLDAYFNGCKGLADCTQQSYERHARLKTQAQAADKFWSETCRLSSSVKERFIAGVPVQWVIRPANGYDKERFSHICEVSNSKDISSAASKRGEIILLASAICSILFFCWLVYLLFFPSRDRS